MGQGISNGQWADANGTGDLLISQPRGRAKTETSCNLLADSRRNTEALRRKHFIIALVWTNEADLQQPDLAKDVPAHGRQVGLDDL